MFFRAFLARVRVTAFLLRPDGAITASTGSRNTAVNFRLQVMVRRVLLMVTSIFIMWGILYHTDTQCSATEKIRASVEILSVLAWAP